MDYSSKQIEEDFFKGKQHLIYLRNCFVTIKFWKDKLVISTDSFHQEGYFYEQQRQIDKALTLIDSLLEKV